jgi:DNA-directed RNA polymerase
LKSEWISLCVVRLLDCTNVFWQTSHLNGFSKVCSLSCAARLEALHNDFSQYPHLWRFLSLSLEDKRTIKTQQNLISVSQIKRILVNVQCATRVFSATTQQIRNTTNSFSVTCVGTGLNTRTLCENTNLITRENMCAVCVTSDMDYQVL